LLRQGGSPQSLRLLDQDRRRHAAGVREIDLRNLATRVPNNAWLAGYFSTNS
jgi:hypothetical protein